MRNGISRAELIDQHTISTLKEKGYTSKAEYLEDLADSHGIDLEAVEMLADLLGETELFDGLVTSCEDYCEY